MLKDYSMLDLTQMYDDVMDYLVILDGVKDMMKVAGSTDPDINRVTKMAEHADAILTIINEVWEGDGTAF